MVKIRWSKKKKVKDGEGTSRGANWLTSVTSNRAVVEEKAVEDGTSGAEPTQILPESNPAVVEEVADEDGGSGNGEDPKEREDAVVEEVADEDGGSGNGEDPKEREDDFHHTSRAMEGSNPQSNQSDDETEPMGPENMWFRNCEYGKTIKIATKCYIREVVTNLIGKLDNDELEWFTRDNQFHHFFHMPLDKNHMSMGPWFLILRMARTGKKKEAWFIVNGVPIRYSLREHGLFSGLNCFTYPTEYKSFGNLDFVEKIFEGETPTYEVVKKKFLSMKRDDDNDDRLRIAVLYFLSSIIVGQAKSGERAPPVEEIFRRAVGDFEWCKCFPWGRLSFDHSLSKIVYMVKEFNGVPRPNWCLPNFITPLEILAFEAIPQLKERFREEVVSPYTSCPRMCKSKFKETYMRGFSLSEINEALGTTKVRKHCMSKLV